MFNLYYYSIALRKYSNITFIIVKETTVEGFRVYKVEGELDNFLCYLSPLR